jgi:hypothetical protein
VVYEDMYHNGRNEIRYMFTYQLHIAPQLEIVLALSL